MLQTATDVETLPYDHLLRVLGNALDLRDDETGGHSRRVVSYCLEIGRAIGCSRDQLEEIARGAYVHDIGKIAMPDVILRKPGKLTAEEFEVIKTHTWIGYNMLSDVPSLPVIAEMILTHHERWDGRGYPRGLKGEGIPVGARIFAIADTLDAMTTDRPYRKALPVSAARAEINRESGKQFDPKIAGAFLSIAEDAVQAVIMSAKRRSLRVPVDARVLCEVSGGAQVLQAVNVSEGGILLANGLVLDIGSTLGLRFRLPGAGQPLKAEGTVVRKELPARIAVAFDNISPDALEAIREYVGQKICA